MKTIKSLTKLLTMALVAVLLIVAITPVVAEAKTKKSERYFSDVTTKTSHYKQIEWMAKNGAFSGIAAKGKKFKPNQLMTRGEFVAMLKNLYGDRIDISTDKKATKCTQKYVTSTLTKVSKQLGYRVTWDGGAPKAKVTRAKAAYYTRRMMTTAEGGALDPIKDL